MSKTGLAVCIAGMHRSGTSMVAEILRQCGVYLGTDADLLPASAANEHGYFEHRAFLELNDEILAALGGAWDAPPRTSLPWRRRRLEPIRDRARALIDEMRAHAPWGWKDPRNSLTLPLWRPLVPGLRVVVCVRHPLSVADSIALRDGCSRRFGIALWTEYNRRLQRPAQDRTAVVTAYESYFADPEREVRRLAERLGLEPSNDAIARAATLVDPLLRHQSAESASGGLPRHVARLRRRLYALAGD